MSSLPYQVREEAKRKVFTQNPKCGFHTSGYGLQVPIIFHVVLVGSHYPFKRHRVPIFSQIWLVLIDSHLFLPIFFQFLYYVPQFWQFFGLLYWPPVFALFIFRAACGTRVVLLSLRGGSFGMQLPPKIGSLAKTFLLAPSLNQVSDSIKFFRQDICRRHTSKICKRLPLSVDRLTSKRSVCENLA